MALPEVKTATWGGFVFINFDPECEPLESYMEVMPEHFSRYPLEKYFKGVHVQRVMKCNWKVAQKPLWNPGTPSKRTNKFLPSPVMKTPSTIPLAPM